MFQAERDELYIIWQRGASGLGNTARYVGNSVLRHSASARTGARIAKGEHRQRRDPGAAAVVDRAHLSETVPDRYTTRG